MATHRGRVTEHGERRRRPVWWVSLLTGVVVIGLVVGLVLNGTLPLPNQSEPTKPTLIERPTLPGASGGSTAPTFAGVSARCRDGTYAYVGGSAADDSDCAGNGGVEQRFGGGWAGPPPHTAGTIHHAAADYPTRWHHYLVKPRTSLTAVALDVEENKWHAL